MFKKCPVSDLLSYASTVIIVSEGQIWLVCVHAEVNQMMCCRDLTI